MSSGHVTTGKLTLRHQKALGGEFLIFFEQENKKIFFVDLNSLNVDPTDRESMNREINKNKKLFEDIPVNNRIILTATAGNDNILSIAWAEKLQPDQCKINLVAVTRQNGLLKPSICPNGTHTVDADNVEEMEIVIINNEPKVMDIHTQGGNFILEAYGH